MTRKALAFSVAVVGTFFLSLAPLRADARPVVKHPNLLLNRTEIEQIKAKIKQYPWAAQLLARVKELADNPSRVGRIPREAALVYVLTGEKRYGEAVRRALVSGARGELKGLEKLDRKLNPDYGAWGPWATWAWAYDLTYELYTAEERALIEKFFHDMARTMIAGLKLRSTTPNLVFEKRWKVGLLGYVLGDKELIEWGLNDPGAHGPSHGGFYQVLDTMVKDRYFWGEAPIYALHFDVHGMLALAEAALHYDGTDLYHHVSKKSGASIKTLIDGYLRLAFPREQTGIEGGSIRLATFGDGSTSYSSRGELMDTFLVNPVSSAFGEPTLSGELEIAYKRYKDPGYAWLLSLNGKRDQYIGSAGQGHSRPIWGYVALTHGEPLPDKPAPPPAPCGVYRGQGFAMLRSDESPRYWDAGGLAAVLRLGELVGHGHKDYFEHGVRTLQETENAVGLRVEGDGFSDRVLIAFDAERRHELRSAEGESFVFRDYAYLRRAANRLTVRGSLQAFRVHAPGVDKVIVNGKECSTRREGEFLLLGEVSADKGRNKTPPSTDDARERSATLHYHLQPEEVHLRAGGAKDALLHVRCLGQGTAFGKLRVLVPKDVTVEPSIVELPRLREGETRTIRLRFKASAGAASALHAVRFAAIGETPAADSVVPVSIGVVMTEDKARPLIADWGVRAPDYTMRVDQYSGLSYYLLDADGNRRHGSIHNTNFCYGLGAVERDGKWLFRYRTPSRFVWQGKNTLTVGTAGDAPDGRLSYTFHEDRIVLALIPPTNPARKQTMWLGNFDTLGPPRRLADGKGAPDAGGDWFFFAHPRYRQGLLLGVPASANVQPRGTAVSVSLRAGQQVVLRFASDPPP